MAVGGAARRSVAPRLGSPFFFFFGFPFFFGFGFFGFFAFFGFGFAPFAALPGPELGREGCGGGTRVGASGRQHARAESGQDDQDKERRRGEARSP